MIKAKSKHQDFIFGIKIDSLRWRRTLQKLISSLQPFSDEGIHPIIKEWNAWMKKKIKL